MTAPGADEGGAGAGSEAGSKPGAEAPPATPEAIAARKARDDAELTASERFRRGTTAGALGAALAMGMARVFDPVRADQVTVEQEAPSQPLDDEGLELRFDPESARDTVAIVRSTPADHALTDSAADADDAETGGGAGDDPTGAQRPTMPPSTPPPAPPVWPGIT